MARFINTKEEKIINQTPPFIHYLLLLLIIMEIIRMPNLPSVSFGPIYLVALLSVLIIICNLKYLPRISPLVIKIILLLLFYYVYSYILAWTLDIIEEKHDLAAVMAGIRECVELLVFSIACTNFVELRRVLFTIGICLFISALFGLLVHYFGEPFQGIYEWLWGDEISSIKTGQGYRVVGLSRTHWYFGYLMSAGPAIAIICGRLSRFKWFWGLAFLLMMYALYLNGARAAFLASCYAIVALLICWRLLRLPYIFIFIAFILSVYIFKPTPNYPYQGFSDVETTGTLTARLEKGEIGSRFQWWKAGVISVIENPVIGPTYGEYISVFNNYRNDVSVNYPGQYKDIFESHNAYLNPGINMGISGWFLVLLYFILFKKILIQVFQETTEEKQEKVIFEGVAIVVIAPMLNAIFQNESIFNGEAITVCLTGLLIASYQFVYNRNYSQVLR